MNTANITFRVILAQTFLMRLVMLVQKPSFSASSVLSRESILLSGKDCLHRYTTTVGPSGPLDVDNG